MTKKRILLVDDEPDLRQVIGFRLDKMDYILLSAPDGDEALRIMEESHPDIILLDVMLPKVDGFEICKKIKERNPSQKVIMYTAKIEAVDVEKAREAGADDFTVKTTDLKHIVQSIEKLLGT